jgi:hypothetical protein
MVAKTSLPLSEDDLPGTSPEVTYKLMDRFPEALCGGGH